MMIGWPLSADFGFYYRNRASYTRNTLMPGTLKWDKGEQRRPRADAKGLLTLKHKFSVKEIIRIKETQIFKMGRYKSLLAVMVYEMGAAFSFL